MAKKQVVQFIDDLDGKVLDEFETVRWGLDGKQYEFDTSPKHAEQFRNSLQKYLAASRKVGAARQARQAVAVPKTGKEQTQAIREWAREEGYEVSDRGRIPAAILEAFDDAH
jgi:hypothetical protein